MRRRDEVVQVRLGRVGDGVAGAGADPLAGAVAPAAGGPGAEEGPTFFWWRERRWRVLQLQSHWVESGPWWESAGARAVRGDWQAGVDEFSSFLPGAPVEEAAPQDLLCEREVWRLEAASGEVFSRGVFELAHETATGRWLLQAVLD